MRRQKEFQAPVKKNGRAGGLFCCLSTGFCALLSGRPEPMGRKVVVMLTLQDLKWIVKAPGSEQKVPTARRLLEQGERIAGMENGGEVQLLVFREGYAIYRVGKHTTVFPVHGCGDYCYENAGQQIWGKR